MATVFMVVSLVGCVRLWVSTMAMIDVVNSKTGKSISLLGFYPGKLSMVRRAYREIYPDGHLYSRSVTASRMMYGGVALFGLCMVVMMETNRMH